MRNLNNVDLGIIVTVQWPDNEIKKIEKVFPRKFIFK